jgi:LytS/YehU family sensor histidine kinase
VERYVALETMRFGDRLVVTMDIEPAASEALVPVFAVQTLVENAVRHGAAPRVEATHVTVSARRKRDSIEILVRDTGAGTRAHDDVGTGLKRLKERLGALHGNSAELVAGDAVGGGFMATLRVPYSTGDA